jgi:hypothetical protein
MHAYDNSPVEANQILRTGYKDAVITFVSYRLGASRTTALAHHAVPDTTGIRRILWAPPGDNLLNQHDL